LTDQNARIAPLRVEATAGTNAHTTFGEDHKCAIKQKELGLLEMVRLKGENRIKMFRQIAERLVSKIASFDGVCGIVLLGRLVRGFADRFSDLDITVFIGKRDARLRRRIYNVGLSEAKASGIDIDMEIHFIEDFRRWRFDEADRWEFSRAKIVFDPEGEVKRMLKEKFRVSESFWVRRIVFCGEYLKWYCCPLKEGVGSVAECWVERGDLVSAHYCLNYATELLVRIVYALNREFLPAPKWRLFHSYNLKWLPKGYKRLIKEAMRVEEFSVKDFERRLLAVRSLWREILPKIKEETGLTTEKVTKYYVEKVLHQTKFH
jgi:predicted nucleotidyltransferase